MYDQRYHNQIGGLTQDARIEVNDTPAVGR
jgi:hypothetical protein